jgi:lipopolysaccharide O-acetyltransferase
MDFGKNFTCGKYCRFEAHPRPGRENSKLLVFGNNVQINDFVHIVAAEQITIGNNVLMAGKIFISDSNHGKYRDDEQSSPDDNPMERELNSSPVRIEDNVWLGESVTVLQGVTIGKGAIVGAMSLVVNDIMPYSIAVGCPAKVVKRFEFDTGKWRRV